MVLVKTFVRKIDEFHMYTWLGLYVARSADGIINHWRIPDSVFNLAADAGNTLLNGDFITPVLNTLSP